MAERHDEIEQYPVVSRTYGKDKADKECPLLVDLIVEILDARIPASSKNPDLDKLIMANPELRC